MKQEEKELLLKDLCGRLPYGVMIMVAAREEPEQLLKVDFEFVNPSFSTKTWLMCYTEDVKPFLRRMSSMTEEEKNEFARFFTYGWYDTDTYTVFQEVPNIIDWLNKKMFDYRGLIPMGLAIEVTEENNFYKE